MVKARRRIAFVVREAKAEFLEHPPRGRVVRMVTGKQRRGSNRLERERHDRLRGLRRKSLPPVNGPKMKTQLVDAVLRARRPRSR